MVTQLLYDSSMLDHDTGQHPESPQRLVAIWQGLEAGGLVARLAMPNFSPAGMDDLCSVHEPAYVRSIEQLAKNGGGAIDPDTPVSRQSYDAAIMAAGATVAAVDAVLDGAADNVFALVRPPGHHARPQGGMGFCLFNNVAVAVRHALRRRVASKVLIVDWDVHHGNGTAEVFHSDPDVLYFSTHQAPLYPGTGSIDDIGVASGRGATVNVPLPAGVGDDGYLAVFRSILAPLARRFQPQLVVVSAGYDAHWMDPIGNMAVSVAGFAALTDCVRDLARDLSHGHLVLALEGGYSLPALSSSVVATIQVLLGDQPIDPLGRRPHHKEPDIGVLLERLKRMHGL